MNDNYLLALQARVTLLESQLIQTRGLLNQVVGGAYYAGSTLPTFEARVLMLENSRHPLTTNALFMHDVDRALAADELLFFTGHTVEDAEHAKSRSQELANTLCAAVMLVTAQWYTNGRTTPFTLSVSELVGGGQRMFSSYRVPPAVDALVVAGGSASGAWTGRVAIPVSGSVAATSSLPLGVLPVWPQG